MQSASRSGGFKQVAEFHTLITADAGHRRCAAQITFCELIDHGFLEGVFVIQNVVWKAQSFGNAAGIMDVTPGTTPFLPMRRRGHKAAR